MGLRCVEGMCCLPFPQTGSHTNGYSLVRKVFGVGQDGDHDEDRRRLQRFHPELGRTLADALLAPHVCYYQNLKPVLSQAQWHRPYHRRWSSRQYLLVFFPSGLAARLDRSAWDVPPIFQLIQEKSAMSRRVPCFAPSTWASGS